MRWLRFITDSLRAKVALLIFAVVALFLLGQSVNGYLAVLNSGDAELLNSIAILRMLPQRVARLGASEILQDPNWESVQMEMRVSMELYEATLMSLARPEAEPTGFQILDPRTLAAQINKGMFEYQLDEHRVRDAVDQLWNEWGAHKPLFTRVLEGDTGITTMEIDEAATELVDRSDRLAETVEIISNEKIRRVKIVNMIVILGGGFVTIVFYFLVNQMVLSPIESLRTTTVRFTQGDREAQATVRSSDEIGKLAQTFNRMIRLVAEREKIDKERLAEIAQKNVALEKASKMKSEFLANMSHELRTPMNSIIGYSEVLLDGLDGDMNEEQRQDVQAVLRSAEYLLKLINEILDLSKIEAGHMKVDITEVRLRDVVKDVLSTVNPLITGKGLECRTEIPDEDVTVRADRDRLRQIVLNLVSNAVKFTDCGGVTIRVRKSAHEGVVEVVDTGIGIPADQLAVVFDEFHQVDGATTRRHGGTGLGLAIAKRFVELMSGRIAVTSRVGEGSTFHFTLPLARVSPPADPVIEPESAPTILLVDDDADTLALYRRHIEKEKIEIRAARTLSEARDYLEAAIGGAGAGMARAPVPSAVLLDLQLPDGNGLELLKWIRSEPRLRALRVAILSVADRDATPSELGADAHLVKPVGRTDLIALVRTLLGRRAP
jgi:signal transduction histidine kinase/ActR/RegA family two-component response regulator